MSKVLPVIPVMLLSTLGLARADELVAGTEITVRTNESINLDKWDRGRIYPATVDRDVFASDGDLRIPRGSPAELIVRQTGPHDMTLDLESVTVNGRRYVVNAPGGSYDTQGRQGVGENRRTGKFVGGGAVIGGIIGAIAGGGKGAAIGAAAGAASGAGAQMATRGREIHVPVESMLTFRLQQPLLVSDRPDSGYDRDGHHYHEYR
ncbi:MAG TPA: hypothetical protein VKX49_06785 [Bryobacteraceae bacterium]|nr:hypothetical protein [Bryobacteraceae bacterium]